MKFQEWSAAGASDALDFGVQNMHVGTLCSGTAHPGCFPFQQGMMEESRGHLCSLQRRTQAMMQQHLS